MRTFSLILFLFVICFSFSCTPKIADKAATLTTSDASDVPVVKEQLAFPESWVGEWSGELEIWKGNGLAQTLAMNMSVQPADKVGEYHWLTTFGDKAATSKPYLLRAIDAENGVYVIDEQNSIILESYLFDNKLVSWYVVMESLILATFEKKEEEIIFEILAGSEKPISITGGQKIEEEDIPEVKTMPFNVMQRAVLKKE